MVNEIINKKNDIINNIQDSNNISNLNSILLVDTFANDNNEDEKELPIERVKEKLKASLDNIISYIQGTLDIPKTNRNMFTKHYYRTAEEIMMALKPYCLKFKISVQFSEEGIETFNQKVQIEDEKTNTITDTEITRVFLKTKVFVSYKSVVSNPVYSYTEITTHHIKPLNSSQLFGLHESYLKKRALGSFFLIATDETEYEADSSKYHPNSKK